MSTGPGRRSIVIVGRGRVGAALGTNLARLGHRVRHASRDPRRDDEVGLDGAGEGADLVMLAVPFDAVESVVPRLGFGPGTVLVDATNPFGRPVPEGMRSGAEVVARVAGPGVRVVKAFNVVGSEHMTSPPLPDGHRPLLPVAADDDAARRLVVDLATQMGFDAVAVGGIDRAALLEEAARYWVLLASDGGRGRGVVLVAHQRPRPGHGRR